MEFWPIGLLEFIGVWHEPFCIFFFFGINALGARRLFGRYLFLDYSQ
mgnify:CR=1 FL=1